MLDKKKMIEEELKRKACLKICNSDKEQELANGVDRNLDEAEREAPSSGYIFDHSVEAQWNIILKIRGFYNPLCFTVDYCEGNSNQINCFNFFIYFNLSRDKIYQISS